MNYISLINSFWDSAMTNPLSTGQVSLYMALLHVCNRSNWTEWFQAPNQVLSVLTGLSRSGILKARNELKQRGVIDFKERGTKVTLYKVISNSTQDSIQVSDQDYLTMSNSTQVSAQNGVRNSAQNGVRNSAQNGVRNSNTLYKQNKNKTKQETPLYPPVKFFEDFLLAYPKNVNRYLAGQEYANLILTGKVTEEDLVKCASNYAESCKIQDIPERYMKNAENFLREFVFEKYLPANYQKPKRQKKDNKFVNFEQRNTDYDEIVLDQIKHWVKQ